MRSDQPDADDSRSDRVHDARVDGALEEIARTRAGQRVLVIGHVATRWALDHTLLGVPLETLVDAPFGWREGWEYTLPGP